MCWLFRRMLRLVCEVPVYENTDICVVQICVDCLDWCYALCVKYPCMRTHWCVCCWWDWLGSCRWMRPTRWNWRTSLLDGQHHSTVKVRHATTEAKGEITFLKASLREWFVPQLVEWHGAAKLYVHLYERHVYTLQLDIDLRHSWSELWRRLHWMHLLSITDWLWLWNCCQLSVEWGPALIPLTVIATCWFH